MTRIEIYYAKSVFVAYSDRLYNHDTNEEIKDILKHLPITHVNVFGQTLSSNSTPSTVKLSWEEILEYYFHLFNTDGNPLATEEKQEMLRKMKSHTSMSVGDIIQFNDEYHMAIGVGWKLLEN